MESNNNVFKFILIAVFIILVVFGGFLIFKNSKPNKETAVTSTNESPTMTPVPLRGMINIAEDISEIKIKNQVNLKLTADSNGENVTAFDTLISYDPVAVDFVRADSVNPDFKVYSYNKDNNLTLTVAKTNLGNNPSIFAGVDVVKLIFKPKTTGTISFKILPSSGKETTKFVNEKTEIISPNVNEISVVVN